MYINYTKALANTYREEKSLRYVVMVAKFLDDNQPKTKRIRTIPNSIDLIKFHLICQILAKFSEVESERTVHLSKFRKRKRKKNFLCRVPLLHTAGGCVKLGNFKSQPCNNG